MKLKSTILIQYPKISHTVMWGGHFKVMNAWLHIICTAIINTGHTRVHEYVRQLWPHTLPFYELVETTLVFVVIFTLTLFSSSEAQRTAGSRIFINGRGVQCPRCLPSLEWHSRTQHRWTITATVITSIIVTLDILRSRQRFWAELPRRRDSSRGWKLREMGGGGYGHGGSYAIGAMGRWRSRWGIDLQLEHV